MRVAQRSNVRRPNRVFGVVMFCGLLTVGVAPAALGDPQTAPPAEPEGGVSNQMVSDSVRVFDPADYVKQFTTEDFVEYLGDSESEEEDVIVLETDILFAAMEWELPDAASSKIGELVEEIPDGAAVDVHGHTDSNPVPEGYDFDNQVLSENRAEAVAGVLEDARPDLDLSAEGFGEDQPAAEEDEEEPDTFAANRRVEIRYN